MWPRRTHEGIAVASCRRGRRGRVARRRSRSHERVAQTARHRRAGVAAKERGATLRAAHLEAAADCAALRGEHALHDGLVLDVVDRARRHERHLLVRERPQLCRLVDRRAAHAGGRARGVEQHVCDARVGGVGRLGVEERAVDALDDAAGRAWAAHARTCGRCAKQGGR
eukprot:2029144-Prymnesium_polylepis.1